MTHYRDFIEDAAISDDGTPRVMSAINQVFVAHCGAIPPAHVLNEPELLHAFVTKHAKTGKTVSEVIQLAIDAAVAARPELFTHPKG